MSSLIYTSNTSDNPYRTGVLIGNYVEDMYGLDHKLAYRNNISNPQSPSLCKNKLCFHKNENQKNQIISEHSDRFRWPTFSKEMLHNPGNELTMTCTSNFDLNIDFNRKNVQDFMTLSKANEYVLDNKNAFLPDEVKVENFQKLNEDIIKGIITPPSVFSETQRALKQNHIKDTNGFLYTRKNGLDSKLLFGHGCQKNFKKNDLASVYHLSINRKIPTKTFLDSHWKLDENFKNFPKKDRDYSDWGYRKYREYGKFTKKFDKKK